jgi:Glycosyl transferase family 11
VTLIIARLIGGLGNQMFQYAAGRALALRRNADLKLDVSGFSADKRRRYELGALPICAAAATEYDLAGFGIDLRQRWNLAKRVGRYLNVPIRPRSGLVYREPHFHYDPGAAVLCPPVYLDGYWQSERYFSHYSDTLRQELTPTIPNDDENAIIAAQIDAANAVALHVRRGDYVNDAKTNKYHGTCSSEYYHRAVEYIAARTERPQFFVFSDEPEWARSNLQFRHPTTLVAANPADRGHLDMALMSRCRHFILANSSFSWWGAWLNASREKIVVAPSRWFNAGPPDTRDLVPRTWVRL